MDYEKQFKADYEYLKEWYERTQKESVEENPPCPSDLLEYQLDIMYNLLKIMETRADTQGIK